MTVSSFDMTFTARDGAAYDGRMSTPAGDGTAPAILIIPAIFGTDAEMEGLIEDISYNSKSKEDTLDLEVVPNLCER